MKRRTLLQTAITVTAAPGLAWARSATSTTSSPPRVLILIELRGGNDGLNTAVPIDDSRYHQLRPRLALRGDAVVPLVPGIALHASLAPWLPLWTEGEMALLQGVGYPEPNLSHFRSIEIWDTASSSSEVLQSGWLTRAAANSLPFRACAADGVILGAADLGPLMGGARALALADVQRFTAQSRLARADETPARGSLAHVLRVEQDIVNAAADLTSSRSFGTEFPRSPFGQAVRQAALIASTRRVPVVRLTLSGFDTHQNQLGQHAALLKQIADGVVALRAALIEAGVWNDTLVLTYAEFGRRPRENGSGGTDHGTANVQFAIGPRVKRGIHGAPPALDRLDTSGNFPYSLDFRRVYATVLQRWWSFDPRESRVALGGTFDPVDFLSV